MINLAGNRDCDKHIEKELKAAGINIVHGEMQKGEVSATITGKLGRFIFIRYWYYWVVEGNMPLEVARELYANPIGKKDVRVAGHAGCPAPEDPWIEWTDDEGRRIFPMSRKPKHYSEKEAGYQVYVEDPSKVGQGFITTYHIDSPEGLKLFADAIRKHKLFY